MVSKVLWELRLLRSRESSSPELQMGCKIVTFKVEEVTLNRPFGVKVALFRTTAACCLHGV